MLHMSQCLALRLESETSIEDTPSIHVSPIGSIFQGHRTNVIGTWRFIRLHSRALHHFAQMKFRQVSLPIYPTLIRFICVDGFELWDFRDWTNSHFPSLKVRYSDIKKNGI